VYAYKNGNMDLIFDESVSVTGVQIDTKGTIFISDINGNIYRKEKSGTYKKIYDRFHNISKGIQLIDDDEIYLSTLGGGLLKIEGLKNLYEISNSNGSSNNNENIESPPATGKFLSYSLLLISLIGTIIMLIFIKKNNKFNRI